MSTPLVGKLGLGMSLIRRALAAAPLALLASGGYAASPAISADGKALHDANCKGCHDAAVYTRKGRTVRSFDELKLQLDSCGHGSGKELSPAQRQQIVNYLNEQFYKFQSR
jgi:hypothetical protein